MDFKQIQELVRLMSKSALTEIRIEQENFKITLKKEGEHHVELVTPTIAAPVTSQPVATQVPVAVAEPSAAKEVAPADEPKATPTAGANQLVIKSPMIGTFYRSSGPDKEPFVKVGDSVSNGSVLCIIEAMKLFNEIEAEVSGKIVKVLVEDASPVEYDQPLFLIDTSDN